MARKVFISFLGATNYGPCHYCTGDFDSGEKRFIQEATLDYLCQSDTWTKRDVAYILMTTDSRTMNWLSDGQRTFKTNRIIRQPGLYSCLRARKFPMTIKPVPGLPDGNTEDEVMTIFQKVFSLLKRGDELYFDITHGFRYLPIVTIVMGNYSKFLKGVTVKMISYGNFEGRDRKTNRALIMDLTVLSTLQDWANAAGSFIRSGDSSYLAQLAKDKLLPIVIDNKRPDVQSARTLNDLVKNLKEATTDMITCRGQKIEGAEHIRGVKRHLNNLGDVVIQPMRPIIDKVKEEFADFNDKPDVMNGFHAVRWCLSHNLLQQAVTILRESVLSYFEERYQVKSICAGLKMHVRRELISSALVIVAKNTPEEEWEVKPEHKPLVKAIVKALESEKKAFMITDSSGKKDHIAVTFKKVMDIRNDLNHNGMNDGPAPPAKLKDQTERYFERIYLCLAAHPLR